MVYLRIPATSKAYCSTIQHTPGAVNQYSWNVFVHAHLDLCLCLGKIACGLNISVTYPACTETHSPEQLSGIKADSDKLLYIATLSFAFTVLKSLSFLPFLCLLPLRPSLAAGCTSSWIFSDRGQRGNINWQAKPACWDAAHKWNGYK